MRSKTYTLFAPIDLRVALVADLHNYPQEKVVQAVRNMRPDCIVMAGDYISKTYLSFIREMTKIAPTFLSIGNHEQARRKKVHRAVKGTDAVLLDNAFVRFRGVYIGGLSTKYDLNWLEMFCALPDYKVLISHHPEYYPKFLKTRNIDLILAGHAHGGQIRLFGRGLFAPGQGLFPKYTSGVYDNKLIVSRGIANPVKIPRLFNEGEVVCVQLRKKEGRMGRQ